MGNTHTNTTPMRSLLLLCLNGYAISAQPQVRHEATEPRFTSNCNDTHIVYEIEIAPAQSNVLRLSAGICDKDSARGVVSEYDIDNELYKLTVSFEECQLKMYDDKPLYERSEIHYYSSTIKIIFGVQDLDIEAVFHTLGLAVQCSVLTEYEVAFDYSVQDRECENDEKSINGMCVWWGDRNTADFQLVEYTDDTYSKQATNATKETTSGEMIHLGIVASNIPNDFTWAVENCWIVGKDTNNQDQKYLLIDPAGTSGVSVDGNVKSCERSSLNLVAGYDSDASPQFRMKHMLFMLNADDDSSEFTLKCNIKLCCVGNDESSEGECSSDAENAICRDSRATCRDV